jgi:hypothetical protein
VEIGVDVARFGDCESVAYVRRGPEVVAGEAWSGCDLMVTAGRVAALIREWEPSAVKIDAIGLGAGVVDRLREQGFRQVVAVNVAARALNPERYASLRDEIYFALRDRFRDANISLAGLGTAGGTHHGDTETRRGADGEEEAEEVRSVPPLSTPAVSPCLRGENLAPPPDAKLTSQLAALKYGYTSGGQTKVESKEEMRRRGLPSPDRADALALCFAAVSRPVRAPIALARGRD